MEYHDPRARTGGCASAGCLSDKESINTPAIKVSRPIHFEYLLINCPGLGTFRADMGSDEDGTKKVEWNPGTMS